MFSLKNKKILITGGNGFLAKHLFKKLEQYGVNKNNILTSDFPDYDLVKMEDCINAVKGIDVVMHLAGVLGGGEFSKKHPGKIFYENTAMSLNIIEASRKAKIKKFIGIGSVSEYPENVISPIKEDDLWNGYPKDGKASYSLAKRFMLAQGQAYRKEYCLNIIHLLVSNLYGPGDKFSPKISHIIPSLIRRTIEAKIHKKKQIKIYGTGEDVIDFLYVEDAVNGIVLSSENYNKIEPVNIGTGKGTSIRNLVRLIFKLLDYNGIVLWSSTKKNNSFCQTLDISRAKKEFNFRAVTSVESGLKKTIKWYLDNNDLRISDGDIIN